MSCFSADDLVQFGNEVSCCASHIGIFFESSSVTGVISRSHHITSANAGLLTWPESPSQVTSAHFLLLLVYHPQCHLGQYLDDKAFKSADVSSKWLRTAFLLRLLFDCSPDGPPDPLFDLPPPAIAAGLEPPVILRQVAGFVADYLPARDWKALENAGVLRINCNPEDSDPGADLESDRESTPTPTHLIL